MPNRVGPRVIDSHGASATASRTVVVEGNRPPIAGFTVTPNPARVGEDVFFDMSASSDSDGEIARFQLDLDGNGSFETDTFGESTWSTRYFSPGEREVQLRVTDSGDATDTASEFLSVVEEDEGGREARAAAAFGCRGRWRLYRTRAWRAPKARACRLRPA